MLVKFTCTPDTGHFPILWKRSADLNITQTYNDLAKAKREEYKVQLAEWYKQAAPETIALLNKKAGPRSKLKSPNRIPRPMSSFLLFVNALIPIFPLFC